MKLGIIGNGFVGNAIAHAFIPCMDVKIFDKDPNKSFNTLDQVVNDSDVVFISVPTPMRADGTIDLSIVESVFADIDSTKSSESKAVFVLKSTVVPGTTRRLKAKHSTLQANCHVWAAVAAIQQTYHLLIDSVLRCHLL